jgi:eukaryotic-like serine/threonine-protein kinase
MERVVVTAGAALGDRYVVQKPAWTSSIGEAYVGRDTVLDRAVLVFPLPFDDPERVGSFAQIHHPGLLQIYDAGPGWMVCEYPSGGRLSEKIAKGRFDLPNASRAVRDVARALTALHGSGVAHGAIGPDLVVFDEEGRAKLAGASFEKPATTADDDGALGRLAWRTFTGTEPGVGRAPKLPPTVTDLLRRMISSDPVLRPRLREIDETLAPYARTTAAEPKPSFFRQEAKWLVPVLGLIALGIAAVIVGLRVKVGPIDIGGPPKPVASATPLTIQMATGFDPPPRGNGDENNDRISRAVDGQEVTHWSTKGYRSALFGRSKNGVGILFDLGSERKITKIVVKSPLEGWKAEWRIASAPGSTADAFQTAKSFEMKSNSETIEVSPAAGRYWLLWITELARGDSGDATYPWVAQVAEVQFFA